MAKARGRAKGTLFVIATPIGNLEDLSPRARRLLDEAAYIACEDTRRAAGLLAKFGIPTHNLLSLFDHNEARASARVLELLRSGEDVALVSDAGTPLISDPGFELVRAASKDRIRCVPVPGPSAVTAALSVSPIPSHEFWFFGFLPRSGVARTSALDRLVATSCAVVFFESPRRLDGTLAELVRLGAGGRKIFVARELTKLHETSMSGTVEALLARWREDDEKRGEVVCILSCCDRLQETPDTEVERLARLLADELPPAGAASVLAKFFGMDRKRAYETAVLHSRS